MCYLLQTDRRALPRHEYEATAEYVAPASDLEAAVCSAWQAVLHRAEPISVHANFFELGGNSLQAGALCSPGCMPSWAVMQPSPLLWVIECQTIRALAARLADADTDVSRLPPLLQTVDANARRHQASSAVLPAGVHVALQCCNAACKVVSCGQSAVHNTNGWLHTTTNCI